MRHTAVVLFTILAFVSVSFSASAHESGKLMPLFSFHDLPWTPQLNLSVGTTLTPPVFRSIKQSIFHPGVAPRAFVYPKETALPATKPMPKWATTVMWIVFGGLALAAFFGACYWLRQHSNGENPVC